MAGPNEAISSARSKVFLRRVGGAGPSLQVPPGILEDLTFSPMYSSENLIGVGDIFPTDSVVNNTQASIRFSAVFKDDPDVNDTLRPRLSDFMSYGTFDILVMDELDGRGLFAAYACLPTSFDISLAPGRAVRLSFTGIARAFVVGHAEGSRSITG